MSRPDTVGDPSQDVRISECHLDTDVDMALADAWTLLDDGERARAHSFVFEGDREAFVRSHGFLRRRLGEFLEVAPGDVLIAAKDGQKPFVTSHDVEFNLSHSGPFAVLAITRGQEIGIDVELLGQTIVMDDHFEGLVDMVLTAEEQDAIASTPTEHQIRRFLTYWTAKEARMKLTGEGMALEPKTISLDLVNSDPVGYRLPVTPCADLQFIPLSRPDAICCLALRRNISPTVAVLD